jgi:hypothetical protein
MSTLVVGINPNFLAANCRTVAWFKLTGTQKAPDEQRPFGRL